MLSLYNQSKSYFCILGTKSNSLTVCVGLRQGCPWSSILFVIFMDRISRLSHREEGVWFGNLRVASLFFADDVVLLASSSQYLQHALEGFTAQCEAAGMKVSSSKSKETWNHSLHAGSSHITLCHHEDLRLFPLPISFSSTKHALPPLRITDIHNYPSASHD